MCTRSGGSPSNQSHAFFQIPFGIVWVVDVVVPYNMRTFSNPQDAGIALDRAHAVRLPFLLCKQRASYGTRDLSLWSGTTSVSVHAAPSALLNLGAYAASIRTVQNIRGGHSQTALSLSASSLVMTHILT